MELDEFIKDTLLSIKNGIHEANVEIAKQQGKTLGQDIAAAYLIEAVNREKEGYISFDVAVTASSETTKSGGAGIKVAVVNLGGEATNVGTKESVSRIKFNVLPWQNIG